MKKNFLTALAVVLFGGSLYAVGTPNCEDEATAAANEEERSHNQNATCCMSGAQWYEIYKNAYAGCIAGTNQDYFVF